MPIISLSRESAWQKKVNKNLHDKQLVWFCWYFSLVMQMSPSQPLVNLPHLLFCASDYFSLYIFLFGSEGLNFFIKTWDQAGRTGFGFFSGTGLSSSSGASPGWGWIVFSPSRPDETPNFPDTLGLNFFGKNCLSYPIGLGSSAGMSYKVLANSRVFKSSVEINYLPRKRLTAL